MKKIKTILVFCLSLVLVLCISAGALADDAKLSVEKSELKYLPEVNTQELQRRDMPYKDVEKSAWYYLFISYFDKLGTINGVSPTSFAPEQDVTRGEFAKFLATVKTSYSDKIVISNPFLDVPSSAWYAAYVQWAFDNGVIIGKTPTAFYPEDFITREESAIMLYRFVDGEQFIEDGYVRPYMIEGSKPFGDEGDVSPDAQAAVKFLRETGLFFGDENHNFRPKDNIKRCEVMKLLCCYLMTVTRPPFTNDDGRPPIEFIE
ncbi:MAG: S-layer homology domain-containing protein [Clostridiales bacterium]